MFSILLLILPSWGQEELPFWRRNQKLYKQMVEQRRVIVSVNREQLLGQERFRVIGAGVVNAPFQFTLAQVQDFERLPELSSHFQKVVHRKKDRQLYLSLLAFGYQARMRLSYEVLKMGKDGAQIDWIVRWGSLKGMTGHYKLRKIDSFRTEVSLWASFQEIKVPVPEFLLNFTLEVIAEKVAQKMRSSIEETYRKK
ncbi:MAG: hypothetical protein AAF203_08990 [Pseudomonadota bacterium]